MLFFARKKGETTAASSGKIKQSPAHHCMTSRKACRYDLPSDSYTPLLIGAGMSLNMYLHGFVLSLANLFQESIIGNRNIGLFPNTHIKKVSY